MADIQHIHTAAGPPSTPPSGVGHHFIDTLNKTAYMSVGASDVSDWLDISGGDAAAASGGNHGAGPISSVDVYNTDDLVKIDLAAAASYNYKVIDSFGSGGQITVGIYANTVVNSIGGGALFRVYLTRPSLDGVNYEIRLYSGTAASQASPLPVFSIANANGTVSTVDYIDGQVIPSSVLDYWGYIDIETRDNTAHAVLYEYLHEEGF